VPKHVDHDARRRELAEAAGGVVARDGVDGASLRAVATEAGWSVGSMRHYFATKDELLVFALRYVGERIEDRIDQRPRDEGTARGDLRAAVVEMLPLDAVRRREALVWLAFIARAGVQPGLGAAAERVWRAVNGPLARRLRAAVDRGELPPDFAVDDHALGLQALVDGLVVHLVSTPELVSAQRALAALDRHLATLGWVPSVHV